MCAAMCNASIDSESLKMFDSSNDSTNFYAFCLSHFLIFFFARCVWIKLSIFFHLLSHSQCIHNIFIFFVLKKCCFIRLVAILCIFPEKFSIWFLQSTDCIAFFRSLHPTTLNHVLCTLYHEYMCVVQSSSSNQCQNCYWLKQQQKKNRSKRYSRILWALCSF